jgi:hypothetical protein
MTPVAPHMAQASPAMPHMATLTPIAPRATAAPPTATDGPPHEWLASPIVYVKRPRQPTPSAPTGPVLTTPDR